MEPYEYLLYDEAIQSGPTVILASSPGNARDKAVIALSQQGTHFDPDTMKLVIRPFGGQ